MNIHGVIPGSMTINALPFPGSDATSIVPPIPATRDRAIARLNPAPPVCRDRERLHAIEWIKNEGLMQPGNAAAA